MLSLPGSPPVPLASAGDGSYPRPQMVRGAWLDLNGEWDFALGIDDHGDLLPQSFPDSIVVPYPPESEASGLSYSGYNQMFWYRRVVGHEEIRAAGLGVQGDRLLLHFGAVDYRADVWANGVHLGHHEGGHTPFAFDVGTLDGDLEIVVRAEDDPRDIGQPRGKQDWQLEPHGIWYDRTSGIWQQVWLEAVPDCRIEYVSWTTDVRAGTVTLDLELSTRPETPAKVLVSLVYDDEVLAAVEFLQGEPRSRTTISLPRQANGQAYEALLWSPGAPRLIDATIEVDFQHAGCLDAVSSYLGMRTVGWADGHFMLNDRPCFVRGVLGQGYWPATHLAAPDAEALRREVELAISMGFNTVRLHQKAEDPRFLFWADRLGLMVWGEQAAAFEFSTTSIERTTREWLEILRRDKSHPSIVTWVPLNESWGVQHIANDPAQLSFARALLYLTKSIDPTRLVVSNDGWEHAESDLFTIHDYSATGAELAANYSDDMVVGSLLAGVGPLGRRIRLTSEELNERPVIVSEFGGSSYALSSLGPSWGYSNAATAAEFETILRDQFSALLSSPVLAGFCYTQLTDTLQETNGLANVHREPKLPLDIIRSIVLGEEVDTAHLRRPKSPLELPNPAPALAV